MLRLSATEANSCVVCTADVCTKSYSLCNGRCCRIVTPEGCTTKRGTLSLKSFQRHEGSSVFCFVFLNQVTQLWAEATFKVFV